MNNDLSSIMILGLYSLDFIDQRILREHFERVLSGVLSAYRYLSRETKAKLLVCEAEYLSLKSFYTSNDLNIGH
jgi:hypothetical protein